MPLIVLVILSLIPVFLRYGLTFVYLSYFLFTFIYDKTYLTTVDMYWYSGLYSGEYSPDPVEYSFYSLNELFRLFAFNSYSHVLLFNLCEYFLSFALSLSFYFILRSFFVSIITSRALSVLLFVYSYSGIISSGARISLATLLFSLLILARSSYLFGTSLHLPSVKPWFPIHLFAPSSTLAYAFCCIFLLGLHSTPYLFFAPLLYLLSPSSFRGLLPPWILSSSFVKRGAAILLVSILVSVIAFFFLPQTLFFLLQSSNGGIGSTIFQKIHTYTLLDSFQASSTAFEGELSSLSLARLLFMVLIFLIFLFTSKMPLLSHLSLLLFIPYLVFLFGFFFGLSTYVLITRIYSFLVIPLFILGSLGFFSHSLRVFSIFRLTMYLACISPLIFDLFSRSLVVHPPSMAPYGWFGGYTNFPI